MSHCTLTGDCAGGGGGRTSPDIKKTNELSFTKNICLTNNNRFRWRWCRWL
jgi:hypothetical protein